MQWIFDEVLHGNKNGRFASIHTMDEPDKDRVE